MTGPGRPARGSRRVEVPLTGDAEPGAPGDARPNWRRVVGLATVAGIALGIVVGLVAS